MRRTLALVVMLCIALPACDSADPADPADAAVLTAYSFRLDGTDDPGNAENVTVQYEFTCFSETGQPTVGPTSRTVQFLNGASSYLFNSICSSFGARVAVSYPEGPTRPLVASIFTREGGEDTFHVEQLMQPGDEITLRHGTAP